MPKDLAKNVVPKEGLQGPKGDTGAQGPPGEGLSSSDVVPGPQGDSGVAGALNDLSDVILTSPSDRQVLVHDGTDWVNEASDSLYCRVYNNTGSTISKGSAVYVTGAQNQNVLYIALARADSASTMPCIGLAFDSIAVNAEGLVVAFSKAKGINTGSFLEGDVVYVDVSTAGALTNTKPTGASELIQNVGIVSKVHASNGVIKVTGVGRANDAPNTISISGDITTTGEVSATTLDIGGTNITATATELNIVDADT